MQKQVGFKIRGMQRDLSASAFNSEYAYENKNIRIMPTDDNTLFSIINERGNKLANIKGIGDSLKGIPIGQAMVDNELVIFMSSDNSIKTVQDIISDEAAIKDITFKEELTMDIDSDVEDRIYKLWFNNSTLTGTRLYRGQLNFSDRNPIESISLYENQEIKKVYWTDGINQPRVINIAATVDVISKWSDDSFNFVRKLKLNEIVTIDRNIVANGVFSPGVIQYAFTYFNKYGQESNIFYTSPLYYISYNNRGANPENKVGNSFNIVIENADMSFDYVRVYSIHRTSINSIPTVKRIVDLATSSSKLSYTDNGTSGDNMDPTELLYIGGEEIVFGTLSQKDNTLFLGDITLKRKLIDDVTRNFFNGKTITFSSASSTAKSLTPPQPSGYYPYDNQLKLNSYKIKTFKYLETYRLGVQFQHVSGKWSEPVWVNDVRNTQHVQCSYITDSNIYLPAASYVLDDKSIINRLVSQGYVKVRPVIVYPSLTDRECICQGVLCPTVFNVGDRQGNAPFAQSSWFTRPNAPFDIYKAHHYNQDSSGNWGGDWTDREGGPLSDPSVNSRAGVVTNNKTSVNYNDNTFVMELPNKGAWAEFRHNYPIPSNNERNAEIQCINNPPVRPQVPIDSSEADVNAWVSQNAENFYIDQSIVTLHSPDIEFDSDVRSIDTSGLQLRIVGMVPLTSFVGDIDIQTSTPPNNYYDSSESAPGFYKEPVSSGNISRFGYRGLLSGGFWFDEISDYKKDTGNTNHYATGFVVYPWHRNGSLNNKKWATDGYRPAMLDKKKISNMRFSYNTYFLDSENVYNFYYENDRNKQGISGVAVFDSNEVTLVRLPAQKNSGLKDINYYGNIDKVINIPRVGNKKDGYPIMTTGVQNADTNAHSLFSGNYTQIDGRFTEQVTGVDPVRMRYKSTPHAVIALNYSIGHSQWILPSIKDGDISFTTELWNVNIGGGITSGQRAFWDSNKVCTGTNQEQLNIPLSNLNGSFNGYSIEYGWLWLGELYNPKVINRFGGQTEEAFENNQWLPCGESELLIDDTGNLKTQVTIIWTEGDTYYQRYDHLKTYPFSLEDQNAITDIVSFMCETRVNLDGRYDRNRGQTNNLATTPANFNLMNDVYSQQNNFFNYRTVNPNKLNLDSFHNSITWTKTKIAGELVDTWTNITLASILDLDGDKGRVRAIKRFNNTLLAFQDSGISQILYNENMQITSTEGVPIEIANSGKVNGKRYLSDKIGCANKWSICETPNGIYFIDDTTKGIFLFNGKLDNLSDRLGFHSWINAKSTGINIWNPVDFNGFVTYYDKVNGDVFFISKDECLAFSEPIGQFTSFYSYEGMPYFINLEDRGIALNTAKGGSIYKVWLHNEGEYNMYFDKYQPFYTTVIANPDMAVDKIFNNLEFRADSWKGTTLLNTTFDTLTTWNEYQTGTSTLNNILGRPSELKKKFRVWRANIPRAKSNGRDRMRNPWLYVKLSMEGENTNKTILHDMIVHYFE